MKALSFFFFLVVMFSGCSSNVQSSIDSSKSSEGYLVKLDENMQKIGYKVIKSAQVPYDQKEYQDGKKESLIFYSDNSKDISSFEKEYRTLTGEEAPKFDGTMVVLKMGTKSTGGYDIKINKIANTQRYVLLEASFTNPPKGSIVTMAYTNPYKIIYIPNSHKEVKLNLK